MLEWRRVGREVSSVMWRDCGDGGGRRRDGVSVLSDRRRYGGVTRRKLSGGRLGWRRVDGVRGGVGPTAAAAGQFPSVF